MKSIMSKLLAFILSILYLASASRLPSYTRGVYLLLADNTVSVTNDQGQSVLSTKNWNPKISSWISQYNVVFFTFINSDMQIPPSFENARKSGQIQAGTKIIYSIGGYAYSQDVNGWRNVLGTSDKAKQMASQVAKWEVDGIDLDIEDPAGNDSDLANNIVIFSQELKRLRPDFIITQPVFGYPQIYSESLIAVRSWDNNGVSQNAADAIGIMVYTGSQSLQYVKNYTGEGCTQWWCALCAAAKVSLPCGKVPISSILAGIGGDASQADVNEVCKSRGIGGYMIWYASADNGFQYAGGSNDARVHPGINWICNSREENLSFLQ